MPVPDNSYSIAFRVFDADAGGTEVWTETQTVTVTGGLFSVYLGATTPFPTGAFDGTARYLEVQVDADPAMTPRLLFTSVAYAFRALAADSASSADIAQDLNCSGCVTPGEVAINYAASNVPGGAATDLNCLDCIAGSEAQFNYAGSLTEGGAASDLACTNPAGCVSSLDLGDNQVASVDITDSTITSTDIASDTINATDVQINYAASTTEGGPASDVQCASPSGCISSADIENDTVASPDVQFNYAASSSEGGPATDLTCSPPSGCVSTSEIIDGQVASVDITDNTITASDLGFNYAGSASEGGAANDSQALDGLDSPAFLRSDVDDSYTGNTLTLGQNSLLKYQNADSLGGLRLSANTSNGSQFIYFFDNFNETGQSLSWDDTDDRFEFTNDLLANGNLFFGNTESWVDGGTNTIATGAGNQLRVDNAGLCVDDGVGGECPVFSSVPAGEAWFDGNVLVNAFDIAERFPVAGDALEPGDLVVLDTGAHVRRSEGKTYDQRLAGVVSSDPGLTLGWTTSDDAPVALAGRVPLKVSLENGPIAVGDHLTSSTTPGRAMKATEPGATVGIALEPFDGSQGSEGEVLTFVNLGDGVTAEIVRELQQRVGELESRSPAATSAGAALTTTTVAALLIAVVLAAVLTSAATGWVVLKMARVARS
jgi:hypothetical protein